MRETRKLKVLLVGILIFILFSCSKSANTNNQNVVTHTTENTIKETIEENEVVENEDKEKSSLEIISVQGYRDVDTSTYIEVEFSKDLDNKFDGTSYIKIEPELLFNVSKVNNKLVIRGEFEADKIYKVTALSGIKAIDGSISDEDIIEEVQFTNKMPKIMFSNDGIILPSVNEKKVYIRTLNVNKVKVIVRKIYANNTTQFLQNFDFTGNGKYHGSFEPIRETEKRNDEDDDYWYYYDEEYYYSENSKNFNNVGDELYNVDYDIENEPDKWVQSAIDLSGVIDTNGIYMVDVKFDKKGTSHIFSNDMDEYDINHYIRSNGTISKNILLTDIGIMATKTEDGYHINVLDILDNSPLRGVKTYLMSRNNQILEEKTTDADGVVTFGNYKNGFYILAENAKNRSILVLKNALVTSGFSVDGVYVSDGIKGFIYTERGVYRPGDPVYVSIIARNNDKPLDDNQPVNITVYDPTGAKIIENDVIKGGKQGFYTYSFKTDVAAKTGIWKMEVTIGDKVLNKDISVEAVLPNRIKVNLNIPEVVNYNEEITDWTISSNYLFGEPAGNLDYGVDFVVREEPIDFPRFKDYIFKTKSSYSGYFPTEHLGGTLDENGVASIIPDFDDLKFGSLNLLVDVSGRVTEDSGRNIISKKYLKLKKYDTYLGIENTSSYRKTGSNLDLKVICVTDDGENLVAGKKLKYKIYANNRYWWWDYSKYNDFIRSFKSDKNTVLMEEGEFTTEDTPTLLNNPLPKGEYLYIEIIDESTEQVVGINLESSDFVDPSVTKKIETLNVSTDKKKYSVGDTANLMFKGTANSKAIITIEKAGRIINQYMKDIDSVEVVEPISITKEMAPNVYAYVTLLQDYKTKENDRPLRLYGIVPINVEDEDTKIELEIEAPDEIRPNEKFSVKVKNKKFKEVDFTIAVVDEGLLDINAFKTPSPWEYFFQKIAAKFISYDNYSEIIDKPYGTINQILKVGGDASLDEMARRRRLKELGLEDADRFVPVSMFKGVLTTNAMGEATIDFDMPNYMGQVRIMVIATNGDSYGSADKDMLVKAPLILEPYLPRKMKLGDKLSIPVSVFALEENIGNIEVYYKFNEKNDTKSITLKKGDKETVYFEDEAPNIVGSEKIIVGVRSNVYNYEETVSMPINSNRPPIEVSENSELIGRNEATFIQDKEFVKGTVDSMLTISNTMMLGLDQRLKFLINYPYGCAEQTTSSVFPQLFIEKLSTTKKFDKQEIIDNINAGIERLKLFRLNNGAFSYWPGDKDVSEWATNYIGHFLIYAKKYGYYVPDSMYNGFIDYTAREIKRRKMDYDHDINWKCYALYLLSLAGKSNVSEMNYMYEKYYQHDMDDISKMYLASAYKLYGEQNIATNIISSINVESIKKKFKEMNEKNRYYYTYNYGSELRDMAAYLDCYYTIFGKNEKEAFDEILSALRSKNWHSTQETAYSLLALSNIVDNSSKEIIKGIIDIDGTKTEYSTENQYRMKIDENAKNIKVIPGIDGNTYVNYYLEGVLLNDEIEDYADGFNIERNFYTDEGNKINVDNVKSGDTFWLEVVVSPTKAFTDDLENIALVQILPSGWEIENLRLLGLKAPSWVEEKEKETKISYTDIRDDRIMWFFNYSGRGIKRFLVKLNAVTRGEFDFPGTTLEAMYDNNYKAYKKGGKVKVN